VLREIPDKAFDLCLTDPPYGIGRFGSRIKGYKKLNEWDVKPNNFDDILRVSKYGIIWGANNFSLPSTEYFIVWNKFQTIDNFASAEYAWTNYPMPAKVFDYSIHQHNQTEKYHPTQKPIPLFVWCLLNYSKPGDLVIDPFCGSGTTALACHKTGRKFLCIDKDEEYIKIAQQRYTDLIAQQDLFGEDGAQYTSEGRGTDVQHPQVEMRLEQ